MLQDCLVWLEFETGLWYADMMQSNCGYCIAGCSWSNGDGSNCKVRLPYYGIEVAARFMVHYLED
jgi:hypothetical protein